MIKSWNLQEEELRKGGDPKYAHLAMELHVHIEVFAPIPDCYLRMAHAMDEVKKFLMPVSVKCFNRFLISTVFTKCRRSNKWLVKFLYKHFSYFWVLKP